MKPSPCHLLPVFALLLASPASAKDVTLNVPVDVKEVQAPLAMVGAWCYVERSNSQKDEGHYLAEKFTPFMALDAKGSYRGTLTVKMTVALDAQASPIYRCWLAFATANQKEIYVLAHRDPPSISWDTHQPRIFDTGGPIAPNTNCPGEYRVRGGCFADPRS